MKRFVELFAATLLLSVGGDDRPREGNKDRRTQLGGLDGERLGDESDY